MNEIAYALFDSAEQLGLVYALKPFGDGVRVPLPAHRSPGEPGDPGSAPLVSAYGRLNTRERLDFWHAFVRRNTAAVENVMGGALHV